MDGIGRHSRVSIAEQSAILHALLTFARRRDIGKHMNWRGAILYAGLAFFVGLAPGCGVSSLRERREDNDPMLRRAREKSNANDIEGAIEAYKRAIDRRPGLARAHLELALLYDTHLEDYVRAIYHYERYLELRPNAQEREHVRGLINFARLNFAASLPDQPNDSVRIISMLREENAALREQVNSLTRGAPRAAERVTAPVPASTASPITPAPSHAATPSTQAPLIAANATTYVVQPGDTLGRIASRVYGDTRRWQAIYEANRAALPGGPQSIRVGQTLIIPKQDL
jgi:tetratricopeptide (TPR) repeat protein